MELVTFGLVFEWDFMDEDSSRGLLGWKAFTKDGSWKVFRKVNILPQHYTASQSRRPCLDRCVFHFPRGYSQKFCMRFPLTRNTYLYLIWWWWWW